MLTTFISGLGQFMCPQHPERSISCLGQTISTTLELFPWSLSTWNRKRSFFQASMFHRNKLNKIISVLTTQVLVCGSSISRLASWIIHESCRILRCFWSGSILIIEQQNYSIWNYKKLSNLITNIFVLYISKRFSVLCKLVNMTPFLKAVWVTEYPI